MRYRVLWKSEDFSIYEDGLMRSHRLTDSYVNAKKRIGNLNSFTELPLELHAPIAAITQFSVEAREPKTL